MTEEINTLGNSTVTSNMPNKSKEGVIGPIYQHIPTLNDGNSQMEDEIAVTERNDTDSGHTPAASNKSRASIEARMKVHWTVEG